MKEYLFVYGQFRDTAKKLLKEPVFCGKTTIKGKIYKVNEFYQKCNLHVQSSVASQVCILLL